MPDPLPPADERRARAVEIVVVGVVLVARREWRPPPEPVDPVVGWTTSTDLEW